MRRRDFLALVGGTLAARSASAQRGTRIHRVAVIFTTSPLAEMAGPDPAHPTLRAFVRELRALGYREGENLILERRSLEGRLERYPDVVAEVVRLRSDVIVSAGAGSLLVRGKAAWQDVPVVMYAAGDPVPFGLAKSLAHPGGNVTGLLGVPGPEISAKRLQLLKEVMPRLSRVAYLSTGALWQLRFTGPIREAAPSLGIELLHAEHQTADLEATFSAIERIHPEALFVSAAPESFGQRRKIVDFARKLRLPGSYPALEMVELGGLMSYSPDFSDVARRAAHYVDQILKGARPGNLPIEGPSEFILAVNLAAAAALGLAIPPSILRRADRVIGE
jgi:putative ABC transport system substrate-binding protein